MRTKPINIILSILLAIVAVQFTVATGYLEARGSRNIILVLDTSMSMIGQAGGKNIFDKVKKSIKDYIDQSIEDGDRVTFVTFDTDVRIYPSVIVDDDNDRDILKKYIAMTQSTGLWTYTYKMIDKVFEAAEKIAKEKDGEKTEIVIMTDAIDDPPPSELKRFNLKNYAEKYGKKKGLWIYILSYANVKDTQATKKLSKDLALVTDKDKIKIIQTSEPEKATKELIKEEKTAMGVGCAGGGNILLPLLIAGGCILLVLALIFLIKKLTELKVSGKLEYWNNEVIEPYIKKFDLSLRRAKEAQIGKGFGCVLNINDINIKTPVTIKAVRHGGSVRMRLIDGKGTSVEMINRESDGFLTDGDIFKAGNYTFKYFAS